MGEESAARAIAIVGAGAILPDAQNVAEFWANIKNGLYSITAVPSDRWDPALYYDPDPKAPEKTYSRIGGWVLSYPWDPMKWKLAIPPRVVNAMDGGQKWALACTREALADYGYPERPIDADRTAVIIGNAMAGEQHYLTSLRINFPEYARELSETPSFAALPASLRNDITRELRQRIGKLLPEVTEDSMPGELANCIAGRVANVFNFRGPNFTADAACASAMAAINAAVEGLLDHHFDVAVTGGVDRNMAAATFVKFCKIGALSSTGSRPFAEGADGFVMGEGAAFFLLKRLADAVRDGDKVYAVIRGIGAASDGKGKGITAPNPVGQTLAIERAWKNAGLSPETATYIEGHGTSTSVGDFVEVESMTSVLRQFDLRPGSIALGSVKSNIGHLKGAAGAAGLLKGALALRDRVLPPSLNCEHRNPNVDFAHSPLAVNTELRPWPNGKIRRMGASAFGFGGTNWHVVLEEYVPDSKPANFKTKAAENTMPEASPKEAAKEETAAPHAAGSVAPADNRKAPLRGALVVGAESTASLVERLRTVQETAAEGRAPARVAPADADLRAPERVAIDYADAPELAAKATAALKALQSNQPAVWKALRAQGIFRGQGPAPKVAFLYTGQGSQYANMSRPLRGLEPIVADVFAEADRIMQPVLGKPLSDFVFIDSTDPAAVERAERDLSRTEITQPAVLTVDIALTRLMAAYGIAPDFVMGHSLGEYGALVAAGALPFADALHAVAARGREMARVSLNDNGKMAAVFAPLPEIEKILSAIDGYVVIANINSGGQAVIGGASTAVEKAVQVFLKAGYNAMPLPVSHAFHTSIVAPASEPLRAVLKGLRLGSPRVPVITNVTGDFYPTGSSVVPQMIDLLARQVASPVQFVKGLETLWDAGARVFVEVGPKKALHGFAESVLEKRGDVAAFFTNHPKFDDAVAFNQALCGLYAAGLGTRERTRPADSVAKLPERVEAPEASPREPRKPVDDKPVVITGAALGLPGTERIFDDGNVARILRGEQLIRPIPERFRQAMAEKHITRLVKTDNGGPVFEDINSPSDVIQLAGRGGAFDLQNEFGISAERVPALDRVTQLAIAAGLDALRDAGIPLVLRYKTTTTGSKLPDRWGLPDFMRDDTGVIFASCWPGFDSFAEYLSDHYQDRARREQLATLESVRQRALEIRDGAPLRQDLDRRIADLRAAIEKEPLIFDRRFLLRTLAMGHSQFAELIGARGPNIAMNSACASTPQAVALAQDWIRAGRCRRVIVIAADDVTSDNLIEWIVSGFLASGAAATDKKVEEAALPFDKRRHGMLVGMGAIGMVVESADSASERGLRPICEVLSAVTANSAFHGTRLDIEHICQVMERLVSQAESRPGFSRREAAPKMMFVSHETYTPARGGSASAEINALRRTFGQDAERIVIANTKGLTGHTMGTGIEDVVAVKALETGLIPAVPNFKEIDPELGALNLSEGGEYPVEYALRLGAGFGSQISMTLLRRVPTRDDRRPSVAGLGYAYRIEDEAAWNAWLERAACGSPAELEVVRRTLRIRDRKGAAVTLNAGGSSKPAATEQEQNVAESAVREPSPAPAFETQQASAVPKPEPTISAAEPAAVPNIATPSPAISANYESVKERILELVVEKTGYPKDMLALDLDLEADLGVDTVKQAELFAAVREIYNIPRDPNLKLRDFPTLAHVIGFVKDRRSDMAGALHAALQSAQATTAAAAAMATPEPVPEPPTEAVSAVPPVEAEPEAIKEQVLNLVVEKTGYPKDMLALDLDLEADLGVDTVKQAEMFAAIREIYAIPRDPNLKLRDFPTLAAVIGFVKDRRPDLAGAPPAEDSASVPAATVVLEPISQPVAAPASPALQAIEGGLEAVKERILELVVEKTGYPKDMLGLDLDLEADLGVDTVKQAEMFAAIREIYAIPRDPNLKLREFPTLAAVIDFVKDRRPDLAAPPPDAHTAVPLASAAAASISAPQPGAVPAMVIEPAPVAAAPNLPPPVEGGIEAVKERILDLVVEKTGYPKEMLDLDLDLEADLGIDTVKQAEMFAAIRETYNIPRDSTIKLRDFPTLAHVIGFVTQRRPDLAGAPGPASAGTQAPAGAAPGEEVAIQPPQPAGPEPSPDAVRKKVLQIVAEKTGYPQEMLDLDLDLEADLGIDTVKQAEMFASVRQAFGIVRDTDLKLRDFPTLAHVIQFAMQRRAPARAESDTPVPKSEAPQAPRPVPASFEATDRIPRRVPVPRPKQPLAISKPTGVSLGPGSRVVVAADQGGAAEALIQRLKAMEVEVLAPENIGDGVVQGVYWLPALDDEGALAAMDLAGWRAALQGRVKSLYAAMRGLYDHIAKPGTFLISATRLGGQHGYNQDGATCPLGGAVAGFTKAYKRERNDALVKTIDFELRDTAADIAGKLIDETLRDPGVVEVGYSDGLRWTIELEDQPVVDGRPGLRLGPDTVFLITGAAGGITSAITGDLASASGGTFYLLDLAPEPDPNNPDLARFSADKDGLKRDLFARIAARGERATPARVEQELFLIERTLAAKSAIDAVRAAGGKARYFSVDLTDANAAAKVIDDVRKESGHIDALLHAAGMERSHFLPDKNQREFDLVFDVKADGWFNLMRAIGDMPLGAAVVFSSIAGRFGNAGQTDYSAANDLLCKIISNFRTTRPATRGIAVDWTAWGGIGMASRGSIPKMMELAGIDMLSPEAGVPFIRRELTAGARCGEVVVAERLGILAREWDETGGVDPAATDVSRASFPSLQGPMIGRVVSMTASRGLVIETTLDPKIQPFLNDHRIDGTPVLPGVMGIEAFAEAAHSILLGWHVTAIENMEFAAPFKFYRDEPRTFTIEVTFRPEGADIVANCRLIGIRQLPHPLEPQITTHFTGMVRLSKAAPQPQAGAAPYGPGSPVIEANEIYRLYFHGPAYQVLHRAWSNGESVIGEMAQDLPGNHYPGNLPTLALPRCIELCFQTAGIWKMAAEGKMALPLHVDQITLAKHSDETAARLYSVAMPAPHGDGLDAVVVDESGNRYASIVGYRTVTLSDVSGAEQMTALLHPAVAAGR